MNKYALDILKHAYSEYQKNPLNPCSVVFSGSADDIVALRNALKNLEDSNYVEILSFNGLTATFNISTLGVEYMSSDGKF